MPRVDLDEARSVDGLIRRIRDAETLNQALQHLRALFVERLDFTPSAGTVAIAFDGANLEAARIAERDGVRVVAIAVPKPGRVTAADVWNVLKRVRHSLAGDILLIAANADRSQWNFIYPTEKGGKEILRRMLVERGLPFRTVSERLSIVYDEAGSAGDLRKALERAYDVEAVTKRFFQEYRRVFEKVMALVGGLPSDEDRKLFCQTLFNRLMFLYFLQRKGWLRFSDDPDYLDALWTDWKNARHAAEPNFYGARLKILFFTALNNEQTAKFDRARPVAEPLIGRVPFLNGGLFDESEIDALPGVTVPNEAIDAILHELFEHFNFTIAESTPYDVQVAVDPEMLGKVFEELVTGRHQSGSYYTPRPVVSFMCREALKRYLQSQVPGLSELAVAAFIDEHAVAKLTVPQAPQILRALERITVVDPACGSGAYLLGMLHELMDLQQRLYSSELIQDAKTFFETKLHVIERNLYGADVDPFAVNIAMLRLWLSLVIDYDGPGSPPPLPNLNFKIVCGDSLTAPNPDPRMAPNLFHLEVQKQSSGLARLKALFMRETGEAKRVLGQQIEQRESDLSSMLAYSPAPAGAIDWRVEFAEVFALGGFDVVLANPPYVRADENMALQPYRIALKQSGVYQTLYEKWDLFIPFLERAYQLLAPGGRMVFIISDSYNLAKYARRSHEYFVSQATVERIDFCSDIPLFAAGVRNSIVHFSKTTPQSEHSPLRVRRWGDSPDDFETNSEISFSARQIGLGASVFHLASNRLQQVTTAFLELGTICYMSKGMVIHADERRYHRAFKTDDVIRSVKDAQHPRAFIQGRDIARWTPRRVQYLEWGTERAPGMFRRPTFPQLYEVSEKLITADIGGEDLRVAYDDKQLLHNHSASSVVLWHLLEGVRNLSIGKTAKYRAETDDQQGSLAVVREDLEKLSKGFLSKYVLAVMNSTVAQKFVNKRRRSKINIYPDDWKQLPIPVIGDTKQEEFVSLVDIILSEFQRNGFPLPNASSTVVSQCEAEIDAMVAELYGPTV